MKNIRNFVIISHIDHGKSTLADRFLELTKTVPPEKMRPQYLDLMDLERERGITIKMQPCRMIYQAEIPNPCLAGRRAKSQIPARRQAGRNKSKILNNKSQNSLEFRNSNLEFANSKFILNLIDTPGHVDFSYEVSRALAAVEGAILLVDGSQGIQAQSLSNLNLAKAENLVIIPVVNKIDLPSCDLEKTKKEIVNILGCREEEIIPTSAKEGKGIQEILEAVVKKVPPPLGDPASPLKALVFDSFFDPFRGVILSVRIKDGSLKKGEMIKFMAEDIKAEALDLGYFSPQLVSSERLSAGEIGYLSSGIKEASKIKIGDTITSQEKPAQFPLPGYKKLTPFVFVSLYESSGQPSKLKEALERLKLQDASLTFSSEKSDVWG